MLLMFKYPFLFSPNVKVSYNNYILSLQSQTAQQSPKLIEKKNKRTVIFFTIIKSTNHGLLQILHDKCEIDTSMDSKFYTRFSFQPLTIKLLSSSEIADSY